jgi:hypothetical protein
MTALHLDKYAYLSGVSLTATALITGIHHVYREGWVLLLPSLVILVLPYVLLRWSVPRSSRLSVWAFGAFSTWLIAGFGIVDGLLDHVVNAVLSAYARIGGIPADRVDRAFRVLPPTPLVGDFLYEATGILEFAASAIAAYYVYRFLYSRHRELRRAPTTTAQLLPSIWPVRQSAAATHPRNRNRPL